MEFSRGHVGFWGEVTIFYTFLNGKKKEQWYKYLKKVLDDFRKTNKF